MSSKKAKELKALALSLSIVNDDLTKKKYFRKSEYYKETDKYLQEVRARNLAALELAKELQREQPMISALLTNVLNNAPVEVLGHGDDEEVKEGEIKTVFGPAGKPAERVPGQLPPIVGSNLAEIEKKKQLRQEAKSLTDATLKEVIDKLRRIPEEKAEAKELDTPAIQQRKALFEELINRKIKTVKDNSSNIYKITNEELRNMNKSQIIDLLNHYNELETVAGLSDDFALPDLTEKSIARHQKILNKRLERMEKQEAAELELRRRAERKVAEPTIIPAGDAGGDSDGAEEEKSAPPITRTPTPPAAPAPTTTTRRRGRPSEIDTIQNILQNREQAAVVIDEDKQNEALGKFYLGEKLTKKDYMLLPIDLLQDISKLTPQQLKEQRAAFKKAPGEFRKRQMERQRPVSIIRQRSSPTPRKPRPPAMPRIIVGAEREGGAPEIQGEGMRDYMAVMKGKRPTKDMKKLILLIGSKQAGNNSPKLNLDIEKLIFKIKQDVEKKIKAHKTKLAKQELKAIAREKQKLKIKALAKKELDENTF